MTSIDDAKDIPYEVLPILASNPDFIAKAERLKYLKQVHDQCFNDKKDASGVPIAEFGRLKIELGAMVLVAGVSSVAYGDLRIANIKATSAGDPGSGSVSGALLVGHLRALAADDAAYVTLLESVIAAAKSFDEDALMELGIPPHVLAQSRGVGKGRAGSVRVEWIGKRGPGSGAKGTVQ